MDFKNKKFGFTLMEIMIAVFVVVMLAMLTIPIVTRQIEKAEDYSYYVAYKTVEQMAGQIVALGDPNEVTSYDFTNDDTKLAKFNPYSSFKEYLASKFDKKFAKKPSKLSKKKSKSLIATFSDKVLYAEGYIFNKMFPSVMADSVTIPIPNMVNWDSDSYDYVWLAMRTCKYGDVQKADTTSTDEETGVTTGGISKYTKAEFNDCKGWTVAGGDRAAYSELTAVLPETCSYSNFSELGSAANFIANQAGRPDAKAFCNSSYFKSLCAGGSTGKMDYNGQQATVTREYVETEVEEDDGDDTPDDVGDNEGTPAEGYTEAPTSEIPGICKVDGSYTINDAASGSSDNPPERATFTAAYCNSHGYVNMTNQGAPDTVDCVCKSGYVLSFNNNRACVRPCTEDSQSPYASSTGAQVCCSTDFNQNTGTCCPEHSSFDGSACVCTEAYDMVDGVCKPNKKCTKGSTWSEEDQVCVVNPPIIKAQRFCQRITEFWNISSSSCGGWSESNGVQYSAPVYSAALGNTTTLMSVDSKKGAFNAITPHITFANGLKLWILSDKAASIQGLTYTNTNTTASRNVCKKLDYASHARCSLLNGGFFCKMENTCFKMDDASMTALGDARNCCATPDMSSILNAPGVTEDTYNKDARVYAITGFTVFVDINGNKGSGTLWEDVYPFYIATNGTVYPAYPLDAPDSSSVSVGGNSVQQLPVDVYYYESTENARVRRNALTGVSFARGMCTARKISKNAPYCLNLRDKFSATVDGGQLTGDTYLSDDNRNTSINPCDKHVCHVAVRKRLRPF